MPTRRGEQVEVTSVLRNILDNYPSGSAILRETLQNSDDARARKQLFILDPRTFSTDQLYHPALATCQGPALISVNDSLFNDGDWKAITTILQSSKSQDESATGKYGLGFRSCYHITDNPHILSNSQLLILDPHHAVPPDPTTPNAPPGGVDFGLHERSGFASHFQTFESVLTKDATEYLNTAIRLPLRLPELAQDSRIKNTPTTVDDMQNMLVDFAKKELRDSLLFLKHIIKIEVAEVDMETGELKYLAKAWIEDGSPAAEARLKDRTRDEELSSHELTIWMEGANGVKSSSDWQIVHSVSNSEEVTKVVARSLNPSQVKELEGEKLTPHVALAYPLRFDGEDRDSFRGRLFTILPLPILSSFPLHLHALLALTSSRQNLRNTQDVSTGSREHLLVEWNRIVFTEFAPRAWAELLRLLVLRSAVNVFDAWPSVSGNNVVGDAVYWQNLPSKLLTRIAQEEIWPVNNSDVVRLGQLKGQDHSTKLLVAPQMDNAVLLHALGQCQIYTTSPPDHLYRLIATEFNINIMSPKTVYLKLQSRSHALSQLAPDAIAAVLMYLSSTNDVTLLHGLPIIRNVNNSYTTLVASQKYLMATSEEAELFGRVDTSLLALEHIPEQTQKLLADGAEGWVRRLDSADVQGFVERLYNRFNSSAPIVTRDVTPEDMVWLVKFWTCMSKWAPGRQLLESGSLNNLHLLPTQTKDKLPAISLVGRKVLLRSSNDSELLEALRNIGLPIVHEGLEPLKMHSMASHIFTTTDDMSWILTNVTWRSLSKINSHLCTVLYNHFSRHMPAHLSRLSSAQLDTLRQLPIFPLLSPGRQEAPESDLRCSAITSETYIAESSVTIIPVLPGHRFIPVSSARSLLGTTSANQALSEVEVLEKAIADWDSQIAQGIDGLLIDRIMRRLGDLSEDAREKVKNLAVVTVDPQDSTIQRPPVQVIDPTSSVSQLFEATDLVLPSGDFLDSSPKRYLQQLRTFGLIQTQLNHSIVTERIKFITTASTPFARKEALALRLLGLLDEYCRSTPLKNLLPQSNTLDRPWLPAAGRFYRPAECQDSQPNQVALCDLVRPLVPYIVQSEDLRRALGWGKISFEVVQEQLLEVISGRKRSLLQTERVTRLNFLLIDLGNRFALGEISTGDLQGLTEDIGDQEWVPTTIDTCVVARRATFAPVDIGTLFSQVSVMLSQSKVAKEFLSQMGVEEQPTFATLCAELNSIGHASMTGDPGEYHVKSAIQILEHIATMSISPEDESRALIPDVTGILRPRQSVLFNDRGFDSLYTPSGHYLAHATLSRDLAERLKILTLSEFQFSQDEEEFYTFRMEEELPTRIHNVLREYDIDYSSNEWVANADDANAKTVSIIIDEAKCESRAECLLVKEMKEFNECPALVIHNNTAFTEEDFEGLGNIGKGGKGDNNDAIGRFGLGALSFYHFTDMPMIVSSDSVLFLDPLQGKLPRLRNGARRTGIKMSLSFCQSRYPDQLAPLHDIHGFSHETSHYAGTLIRLPLRTTAQADGNKLSAESFSLSHILGIVKRFQSSAVNSLFFTKVESISAYQRSSARETTTLWTVEAVRSPMEGVQARADLTTTKLDLHVKGPGEESVKEWLVTRSQSTPEDLGSRFSPLFPLHRLPNPTVAMAYPLPPVNDKECDRPKSVHLPHPLLFAGMPLPINTSLNVHLHGTWILSKDRRSIRFDAADVTGHRTLDSEYNQHLLEHLVPKLYLSTLSIVQLLRREVAEFPKVPNSDISRTVVEALHRAFVTSEEPLCWTVTNELISPKDAIFHTTRNVAVRNLLKLLKIPNYVDIPRVAEEYVDWEKLKTDTPTVVHDFLLTKAEEVRALFATPENKLADHVESLILYLLEGEKGAEQDLQGVPLLLLHDGTATDFKAKGNQAVYYTADAAEVAALFSPTDVLGAGISSKTRDKLLEKQLNVVNFNGEGLRDLLQRCPKQIVPAGIRDLVTGEEPWFSQLERLINRLKLSNTTLDDLKDLPIIPTTNNRTLLSLDHVMTAGVLWRDWTTADSLVQTMLSIGAHVINPYHPILPQNHPETMRDEMTIVRCLFALHIRSPPTHLPSGSWSGVAAWIRNRLQASIDSTTMEDLEKLKTIPIWEASDMQSQAVTFQAADQVEMVPKDVDLNAISAYLQTGIFVRESNVLSTILGKVPACNDRALTLRDVIQRLDLPSSVSSQADQNLRHVLHLAASTGEDWQRPLIPSGDNSLSPPQTLYHHEVDLYAHVLRHTPHLVVHPEYRDMMDQLLRLGVKNTVTVEDLLRCVKIAHADVLKEQLLLEDAAWLWNYVIESHLTRSLGWEDWSTCRFIPGAERRSDLHRSFDVYASQVPDIASSNRLVLEDHIAVAWTQRRRFEQPPPPWVTGSFPELGVPTIDEVVTHLKILTTQIAPDHHGDMDLLQHIKAAYQWLLSKPVDEVRPRLEEELSAPIWLNVDSSFGPWLWRSAEELIFGFLIDDDANNKYEVREYLQPYKTLLLTAGVREFRYAEYESSVPLDDVTHDMVAMTGWRELRDQDLFTDIQFTTSDGNKVKAHRAMLAAVVPHFRAALSGGEWAEGRSVSSAEPMEYPSLDEDVTHFAISTLINFVYTGEVPLPTFSDREELFSALRDLLSVLQLANYWGMGTLKSLVEKTIIEGRLVHLDTWEETLETAVECDAAALASACRRTRDENAL